MIEQKLKQINRQLHLATNFHECLNDETPGEYNAEVENLYSLVAFVIQHNIANEFSINYCKNMAKDLGFDPGIIDIIYNELKSKSEKGESQLEESFKIKYA